MLDASFVRRFGALRTLVELHSEQLPRRRGVPFDWRRGISLTGNHFRNLGNRRRQGRVVIRSRPPQSCQGTLLRRRQLQHSETRPPGRCLRKWTAECPRSGRRIYTPYAALVTWLRRNIPTLGIERLLVGHRFEPRRVLFLQHFRGRSHRE